ncbi:MAG: hypothetical protein AB1425_04490 [Actinomycetota bacterium]
MSTFEGPPEWVEDGVRLAREVIVPAARLQDGFCGIYILVDRESGRSLCVTLWETEEDLRASEEAVVRAKAESVQVAGASVASTERYEVALNELVSA